MVMPQAVRLTKEAKAPARAAGLVYEQLRHDILGLKLPPGLVLNRGALQARFGFSSTPVRDALIRLGEDGLVDIYAQSATRVSLIDIQQARQAQFLRRALEQEAVEIIAVSPDRSITHDLRVLIDEQRAIAAREDLPAFDGMDRRFHRHLFEAAGVVALYDLVRRQSGHIERLRQLHLPQAGRMQEIIADHEVIVDALKAGDAAAARAAVRDHLSRSLAYSPRLRELHPAYFVP